MKNILNNFTILTSKPVRLLYYALSAVLLAEFIHWDAGRHLIENRFSEESSTEHLQSIFLVASIGIYLLIMIRYSLCRYTSLLLGTFMLVSLFREQDLYFEEQFGQTSWMYPVMMVLLPTAYTLGRNFRALIQELSALYNTLASGIFLSGLITTFVFSRLFGRKIFWYRVMEENYIRAVKNAAEECLELYGYMFLLIAALELLFYCRQAKKRSNSVSGISYIKQNLPRPILQ